MPAAAAPRRFRRLVPLLLFASIVALVLSYTGFIPNPLSHTTIVNKMAVANPPRPLRLAIFECDTPQPQTRDKFGGYGGVFTNLLERGAETLEPPEKLSQELVISSHDVVNDIHSYPALEDIDAVLISGSRHNAFDNDPWIIKLVEYTKRALNSNRIRVVGVCFGHQIVGRSVGAGVGKSDKGWEVAVTDVDLTDKGKEIFKLDKIVSEKFDHGSLQFDTNPGDYRVFTRCIATLSTASPTAPSRLGPMDSARYRACITQTSTSPCKVTPSLQTTSSPRFYSFAILSAFLMTSCMRMP